MYHHNWSAEADSDSDSDCDDDTPADSHRVSSTKRTVVASSFAVDVAVGAAAVGPSGSLPCVGAVVEIGGGAVAEAAARVAVVVAAAAEDRRTSLWRGGEIGFDKP